MANPTSFNVRVQSRHPRLHIDYDSAEHRYKPTYLHPKGYDIDLDAFPGVEEETITVVNHKGGKTERTQQVRERLRIPKGAVSYEWTIERAKVLSAPFPGDGGSFSVTKSNPIKAGRGIGRVSGAPYKQRFHVPSLGTYEITLRLQLHNGTPLESKVSITLRDFLMVSIGESGASGEGNPDEPGKQKDCDLDLFHPISSSEDCIDRISNLFKQKFTTLAEAAHSTLDLEKDPIWFEEKAHRSLRSGPARAARSVENLRDGTMVTFLSFARSGSEIQGGLLGPRSSGDGWIGDIGQIQEIKNTIGKRRIDALVIAIGGNDVGFADDLSSLVSGDLFGIPAVVRETIRLQIEQDLVKLDANFVKLAAAVSELNVGEVYLTEYPTAMFDKMKDGRPTLGGACGIFDSFFFNADLDIEDIRLLRDAAVNLNEHLRKAAIAHKWNFISGIADGFAGHGYCSDDPFFWSGEQSLVIQGDIKGTMHPNTDGHGVYARQIAAAVRTHTVTPAIKREKGVFTP